MTKLAESTKARARAALWFLTDAKLQELLRVWGPLVGTSAGGAIGAKLDLELAKANAGVPQKIRVQWLRAFCRLAKLQGPPRLLLDARRWMASRLPDETP